MGLRFLGISVLSQKTHGVFPKEWLYLSYKVLWLYLIQGVWLYLSYKVNDCTSAQSVWLDLSYKVYDCTSATKCITVSKLQTKLFQCSRFNSMFAFNSVQPNLSLQSIFVTTGRGRKIVSKPTPSPFLPVISPPFLWLHHFRNLNWMEAHSMSLGLISFNSNSHPWGHYSFSWIINPVLVHYGCHTTHKHLHTKDIWLFIVSFSTNKHIMNNQNFHDQD